MPNKHKLTDSYDGVKRLNLLVEFRVSLDDLANVLTNYVTRLGDVEEIEAKNYIDTMHLIRTELYLYGEIITNFNANDHYDEGGYEEILDRMRNHLAQWWS